MRKLIFILIFCSSSFFLFSQGYMGKRAQVGYGLYFSPALNGSNGSGHTMLSRDRSKAEVTPLAFNSLHEGFLEFCIKRRTMLGLSAKYYKTTFDNRASFLYYYYPDGYNYETVNVTPTGMFTISGLNFNLYFKFYHRGYLAPWGKYFFVGPSYGTYTCKYNPSEMYIKYQDIFGETHIVSDFGPKEMTYTRFDIQAGFGRNRIVADRISLDYGFNVNVFSLMSFAFDSSANSASSMRDYINEERKPRVHEVNRLNLFFKIAYLL